MTVVAIIGSFGDVRHVPAVAALRAVPRTTVLDYRDGNAPLDLAIDRHDWSIERFIGAHNAPKVRARFEIDRAAIETADAVVVLVSPAHSGRSSHWEAGYAAALGKPVIGYVDTGTQPETAYRWMHAVVSDIPSLLKALDEIGADAHVTCLAHRT